MGRGDIMDYNMENMQVCPWGMWDSLATVMGLPREPIEVDLLPQKLKAEKSSDRRW